MPRIILPLAFLLLIIRSSTSLYLTFRSSHYLTRRYLKQQNSIMLSMAANTRSFYRRQLPSTCISLSSEKGQSLFRSAMESGGTKCFFPLTEHFLTQSEPSYCGISTLVMTLNALSVDPRITWKGSWRWYEEKMLNCCIDLEQAKETGITIKEFQCLARCQGVHTKLSFASQSTVEEFRFAVKQVCCKAETPATDENVSSPASSFLIASYHRGTLGQTGTGHFSPIGAYDPVSDCVLIFDVARFKYGVHWVSLPLLFDAMKPIDSATNQSRGFLTLSFRDEQVDKIQMHQSILFVSKMSDYQIRHEYQTFLDKIDGDTSVNFSDVIHFWSQNETNWNRIWKMVEPQLLPVTVEQKTLVDEFLEFLHVVTTAALRKAELGENNSFPNCCNGHDNRMRTITIRPTSAIFIAYMASLPSEQERRSILEDLVKFSGTKLSDEFLLEQLCSEAELMRLAIYNSSLKMEEST